jgi:hypothetical protein
MILEIRGFVGRLVEMGCSVGRGTKEGSSVKVYSRAMDLDGNDGKEGCESDDGHTDGFSFYLQFH